jgi:predicted XRE-type DNA-binding protein
VHDSVVRDARLGAALRPLRIRAGLRQSDVARASGVSQSRLARIESGQLEEIPIRALRAAFESVGARLTVTPQWNGAALDRLLDERHAALCGAVVHVLQRVGWEILSEVTFSHYGERGSIDVLGVRQPEHVAAVVEVKTELASIEETQRRLDAKVRLAPTILFDRLGWRPATLARILVLPEGGAVRHQRERHRLLLEATLPDRGRAVRSWLRRPAGPCAGIWILSNPSQVGGNRISPSPRRVRRARRGAADTPNSARPKS